MPRLGQRLAPTVSRSASVESVDPARAAELAELVMLTYGDAELDTGVTEPTVVQYPGGSRAWVLPRDQMPEPLNSLHLIAAAAVGSTLVVTFRWGDDDTVYLLPYDLRDFDYDVDHEITDLDDDITVRMFVTQLIEHTLGGPRESWEPARGTLISRRLTVVRPSNAG